MRAHQAIGSDEVARLVPSFLQGSSVVAVVKGHGSFAVGKTLEEAYRYTSSLENSCRVYSRHALVRRRTAARAQRTAVAL